MSQPELNRRGAVVLCGGGSRRMGRDKAWLPFGANETMLQRVVRLLSGVVPAQNIAVVAGFEQRLPALPEAVTIVHDEQPDDGPAPALVRGLTALANRVDIAFAAAGDAPLLLPHFVAAVLDELNAASPLYGILIQGECQGLPCAAVPQDEVRTYPLAAAYRVSITPLAQAAIESGARSLHDLLNAFNVDWINVERLRTVDPGLGSLVNCNTTEEYEAARVKLAEHTG